VKRILFLCTGNSCRSVMAEGLMQKMLDAAGLDSVRVLSAGTHAVTGYPPTQETIDVMEKEGIDVSGHLGQPVTATLIEHADAIFCMEPAHRETVLELVPEAKERTHLLATYGLSEEPPHPAVPDPIGRPAEVYESCLMMIRDGLERVLKSMQESQSS
jgi:protein-tyrosine-phosphatase